MTWVIEQVLKLKADVPLSEMFGYVTTLRTLSSGRATSTMEFSHYAETPSNISEAVIKSKRKRLIFKKMSQKLE
jgi:translation elongation factor EF-G